MESEKRRLFVGGISWETREATLREHFSKYGEVEDTSLIADKRTGHGRGFGFVSFKDPDMANHALQDKHVILDRKVDVKPANPKGNERNHNQTIHSEEHNNGTSTSNNKIFVGGLPLDLTEEEFKSYFGSFGTIIDAVVIHDKETHRPRGFGFVTFDSEDVVNNLLQKSLYELKNKLVEVKRAEPKDMNHSQIFSYHWNNTVLSSGSLGYMPNAPYYHHYAPYFDFYSPICALSYRSGSLGYVPNAPYYHHYAPYFDFYSPICALSYRGASWNYFGAPFYGGATWLHPYGYEVPTFEPNGVDYGAFPILHNIGTGNGFQPNGDIVPYANLAPHDNGNLPQPEIDNTS